ncbi:MAG: hypothetical protein L0Z70_01435 [Chloroflexi bacterium]|nr:hypothetical protein [Chloroflexota bacterium]
MNQAKTQFGAVQLGVVLLAAATAVIHIVIAIPDTMVMFYLNGLGYLALAAALYLPQFASWRRWIRWALIAFTVVTILGWVAVGVRSPLGYADKLIEIALLLLLWVEGRRQ